MENNKGISVLLLSYYMTCPPISGGSKRMLYPAMHMTEKDGVHFTCMYYVYTENEGNFSKKYLSQFPLIRENIPFLTSRDFQFNETGKPEGFSPEVWWYLNRDFLRRVLEELQKNRYDIVQIEHSQFAWLIPHIRMASSVKIVMDCHNLEWLVYQRWIPYAHEQDLKRLEAQYQSLFEWEHRVMPWFDAIFCISPIEKKVVERAAPDVPVYYVPSGASVDDNRYDPGTAPVKRPRDLLFIGSMGWFPNAHGLIWFLDEVYPRILEERPETTLDIIGSGDPDEGMLRRIQQQRNITFWGQIEDEVPFLHQSKVFISPIWIGAGVRLKNPTAWIARLPVVATSLSVEGLEYEEERDLLIGDTPEEFARQTLRLLADEDLRNTLASRARESYEAHYSKAKICGAWRDAYHAVAQKAEQETDDSSHEEY